MVYLMLFIYIILYSYIVRLNTKKISHFIIQFIPIAVLLVLILSLQYNVGKDYFSYLNLADGYKDMSWIERRGEILFVFLVSFIRTLNNPQLIFFIVAIIQVLFLMLITYEIKKLNFKLHHYFFLYFTLSLTFFNQFNGIRQYIAVYIIVYALIKLIYDKKITFLLLVIIASLFHSSAIFFLIFIVFKKFLNKKFDSRKMILVMLGLLIFSSFDLTKYIEQALSYTSYRSYINSSYFARTPIQGIITKIPKLLIVLFSAHQINRNDLNKQEISLINLAYLGCTIQILSFSSTIIWRFYQYVDLFIIFPVLVLFNDESKREIRLLISLSLFIMLILKIIVMPRGEYLYKSILFKY